ncbi:MAG: hypothetical protein ABIR11_01825, partial [Candidatus Limnocylindrales bacterium]
MILHELRPDLRIRGRWGNQGPTDGVPRDPGSGGMRVQRWAAAQSATRRADSSSERSSMRLITD